MSDTDREIDRIVRRVLDMADAHGRLPTPVDDIVAAAGLAEADESLLSPGMLDRAPARIQRAMRGIIGRIRGVLDRTDRQIHLAPDIGLDVQRRFIKLHEVFHHLFPWQKVMVRVDTAEMLSPDVRSQFEMEASRGAAHALFQLDRYGKQIRDLDIGIGAVACTAPQFGASLRAGLRRYVESDRAPMIGFVLDISPEAGEPLRYRRREVIVSPSYEERFGRPFWRREMRVDQYPFLMTALGASAARGTAIPGQWRRSGPDGEQVTLRTEFYCTGYAILGLIWRPPTKSARKRLLVA